MKNFKLYALIVLFSILATQSFAGVSSIDVSKPANGDEISSSVLRSQFTAAYNDINTLYSLTGNSSNPVFSGNIKMSQLGIYDDTLEEFFTNSDTGAVRINFYGYNFGQTNYRNFGVYDGKGNALLNVTGTSGQVDIYNDLIVHGTQTSGDLTVSSVSTGSILNSGNLVFNGNTARIKGNFSGSTLGARTLFQTSNSSSATDLGIIPTGTGSSVTAYASIDPANSSYASLQSTATSINLLAGKTGSGSYLPLNFYTGGSNKVSIDTSGNLTTSANIGIGTTSPIYPLSVIGVVNASGGYSEYSDRSLKDNIKQLDGSLDKLLKIKGASFNWKDSGQQSIGVIAQDVKKVYPELVSEDSEGVLSVRYSGLMGPVIESIRDLNTRANMYFILCFVMCVINFVLLFNRGNK